MSLLPGHALPLITWWEIIIVCPAKKHFDIDIVKEDDGSLTWIQPFLASMCRVEAMMNYLLSVISDCKGKSGYPAQNDRWSFCGSRRYLKKAVLSNLDCATAARIVFFGSAPVERRSFTSGPRLGWSKYSNLYGGEDHNVTRPVDTDETRLCSRIAMLRCKKVDGNSRNVTVYRPVNGTGRRSDGRYSMGYPAWQQVDTPRFTEC